MQAGRWNCRRSAAGAKNAPAMGYTQMELGVYSDNERAIRLYETLGFERWGVLRCAFRLPDGTYRDEIQMGLFLK